MGTLASLGGDGPAVAAGVAAALGLAVPPVPWHTDRTSIAELAAALGVVAGAGAKVALDVALADADRGRRGARAGRRRTGRLLDPPPQAQPGGGGRGRRRAPAGGPRSLVGHARPRMVQEHERAVGGWQAEWETLTDLLRAAGGVAAQVRRDASSGSRSTRRRWPATWG